MPNIRKKSRRWFWWAAAAALLLLEGFVFLRTIPEKRRWAKEPVLNLDLSAVAEGGSHSFLEQPERLEGVNSQLSFTSGKCGVFMPREKSVDGSGSIDFFYLEYEPGNPRFIHDVFGHAPEVCLRATGATLKQEHPSRTITVGGRALKVLVLEFTSPILSTPLWVFRLTWLPEGTPYDPYKAAYTMRKEKLLSGIFGTPKPPARVLLAGASGYESLEDAWREYEALLVSRLAIIAPMAE